MAIEDHRWILFNKKTFWKITPLFKFHVAFRQFFTFLSWYHCDFNMLSLPIEPTSYKSVISSYTSGMVSYIFGYHPVCCGYSLLWNIISIIHIWRVIIQFWLSSYIIRLSWYIRRLQNMFIIIHNMAHQSLFHGKGSYKSGYHDTCYGYHHPYRGYHLSIPVIMIKVTFFIHPIWRLIDTKRACSSWLP